jgi:hypothetical protein
MVETGQTSTAPLPHGLAAGPHPVGLQRWQLLLAFYLGVPVAIAIIFGWMGASRTAGWDRTLAISYWLVMNFSGWWLTDLCSRVSAVVLKPWKPPLWLVLIVGYIVHGPVQVAAAREIITWFQSHLPPGVETKPLPTWGWDQAIDNFMPGIVTWLALSYLFYAWLGLPRYGYVYRRRRKRGDGTPASMSPLPGVAHRPATAPRLGAEDGEPPGTAAGATAHGVARLPERPPLPAPRFLERVAEEVRGEVLALQAEQHYLRVFTDKGRALILYRFSDAVAEMQGRRGTQVHRSWWVAEAAVRKAMKENGAWRLVLQDETTVPVSRTYALAARQAGLIEN